MTPSTLVAAESRGDMVEIKDFYIHVNGLGRIYFSPHSIDRICERRTQYKRLTYKELTEAIEEDAYRNGKFYGRLPSWAGINMDKNNPAEGFFFMDSRSGFVIKRRGDGEYVAVTYLYRSKAVTKNKKYK